MPTLLLPDDQGSSEAVKPLYGNAVLFSNKGIEFLSSKETISWKPPFSVIECNTPSFDTDEDKNPALWIPCGCPMNIWICLFYISYKKKVYICRPLKNNLSFCDYFSKFI